MNEIRRLGGSGLQLDAPQAMALCALCLVLAFAAQHSLDSQQGAMTGVLLYGVAAVIFSWMMRDISIEEQPEKGGTRAGLAPSATLLAFSLGAGLLGCLDLGGNRFRPLGTALWIGGLFVALRHLSRLSPGPSLGTRLKGWWRGGGGWVPVYWLILLAIVLLGGWLRLYRLHEIPADLGPDLIHHYYDIADILSGQYPIHFVEHESLLFYLTALCSRVIGLSPYTLFFTTALIGTVTIGAMYALGAELFGPQVGLLAALLLAINRWHLVLSRSGYPAAEIPLLAILLLYTLARALRRQQFVDFAWCGLPLGLSFYTWMPFKTMPAFVIVALALYGLARGWPQLRPLIPRVLLLFVIAVVVAAPIVLYAEEHPREYLAREEEALRLMREQAGQSPGLATYFWRTLLGLNYKGDQTSRWNVPGARHMGCVSGAWMVLGLAYALWRWRHGYNVLLVSAWFILSLPAVLSMLPNDSASSLRMSGMLGPAVLLAALPLPLIWRAVQAWRRSGLPAQTPVPPEASSRPQPRALALTIESATRHYTCRWQPEQLQAWAAAALVLGLSLALIWAETRETNRFYFRDYVSRAPDRSNYSNAREVARVIENYGDLESVYIRSWEFWFDSKALWANLGLKDQSWTPWVETLAPDQPPLSTISGSALFILHHADEQGLATLRAFFPRGVALLRTYPDGAPAFYAFYVQK